VVLDTDSTEIPVYGEQEESAYNGRFKAYCGRYLPLPAGQARQEGETHLNDGRELREGCLRNRFEIGQIMVSWFWQMLCRTRPVLWFWNERRKRPQQRQLAVSCRRRESKMEIPFSFFLLAILFVALSPVVSCSGGGGFSTSTPPPPAATTTTLTTPSASVNTGATVTLTATVSSASGSVTTGSVTFYDGAASLGAAALNSAGQAVYSSPSLTAGTHSLTASYEGNKPYASSTSRAVTVTVTTPKLVSTVTLTASAASAVNGAPIELVATVAASSGSGIPLPTGTVTFAKGSTALGKAKLNPDGVARFTSTRLPVGSDSIKASYSGDANYRPSKSSSVKIAITAKVTLTLTASAASAMQGAPIELVATVRAASGSDTAVPAGKVTFASGSTTLGKAKLNPIGIASFTSTLIPVGSNSITATYAGDADYGPSTSPSVRVAIIAPVTVTLTASAANATQGAPIELVATVKAASGSGTAMPTGTVTFANGATTLGKARLNPEGVAGFTSTLLPVGSDSITATYSGDADYSPSTSSSATVAITAPVTMTLSSSAARALQGVPIELVATVAPASGSGTALPTGTVTFANGSTTLGTATLNPKGVAVFTSTLIPVGSNSITATYSGDANYGPFTTSSGRVAITAPASSAYTNPLRLKVTGSLTAASCADPAIYKYQSNGVDTWYLYCTSDTLYAGDPNPHFINIFESSDLVNWTYVGNAFAGLPSWANVSGAFLWAPAIKYFNGQYYLYYAASASSLAGAAPAIGVGTSASPAGPFVDSGTPVVEPEMAANCCNGAYRSTIDPDVIQDSSGQRWILFGGFIGGLFVRQLSADGLNADASSEVQVAMDNRYEGGNWWYYNGYYYLFASAADCCNGPLSGYGVFVGRSTTPAGPYLDAHGVSLTATNVGGDPVLKMNGNSVIGPGGNVIFNDESGQTYILYHGILSGSPYYANDVGYTARPGFIDAIDWVNGWPVARGGFGPSDQSAPQPLPVAQPGGTSRYVSVLAAQDSPHTEIRALSDSFSSTTLSSQWSYIHGRPPYRLTGNGYEVQTAGYDISNALANGPLLAESAPAGDYMVETKLTIDLPMTGANADYAQAGLLLYGNGNNFVRLDVYSNSDTRQVEFIKAETPSASGYPNWGATDLGPPALASQVSVWLRVVRRNVNGQQNYTAYSSANGVDWIQGGTWVHQLGPGEKICLYAGNLSGFTADFDYVTVSTLQ
jgi:arabinan endo-1,5-alpha-L-arabinosidase